MSGPLRRSDVFPGESFMARRMRAHDWSTTPLGLPDDWPPALKSAVRIMLTSRYAMWMGWGSELTFLYNDSYARMTLGAKHPWALGQRADRVWEEIWNDIGPLAGRVIATGEATWNEAMLLLLRRSGYAEETYHTFSYSPLVTDSGATAGLLCVVTEDTDRIIGERRLATLADLASRLAAVRREKDVRRAIATALTRANRDLPFALLYLLDSDDRPKLAAAAGFEGSPPTSLDWEGFVADRPHAAKTVRPEAAAGLPTGAWKDPPTDIAVVPVAGQAQDRPVGYLIAGLNPHRRHDDDYARFLDLLAGQISAGLTTSRAYEAERRRASALAEIDRAKTAFFSNVSHEFRTPLTLMMSPIEQTLASDPASLSHENRRLLEMAHRNARRLLKLVNALLDFSRMEAGRARAAFTPVDLPALTADLASNFRTLIERAGLTLSVDCPPLPQPVYVDATMWEKIVLNLLSNAFKFTFEGSIDVTVGQSADGRSAVLTVRDTGVGIARNELPRLFERFHRIEGQPSRSFEGSGVGLALVHELVRQHQGTVDVDSDIGVGTTFRISLPFGTAHLAVGQVDNAVATGLAPWRVQAAVEEAEGWLLGVAADPETAFAAPGAAPRDAGKRPRVLIADDNADMRVYLAHLLGDRYDVSTVPDGESALRSISDQVPDLVLTDVMMPGLDGFGLLARLRAEPATEALPVLLLSARAGEEARVDGLQAGADDYLTKPFGARELLARVESNLKLAALRRDHETRVSRLLDSMTDGVHMVDREGRFTHINAAARRMLAAQGVDPDALIGKKIFEEVFQDAGSSEAGRALKVALATGEPQATESLYPPWGRWYDLRLFPTQDGGVATFFQDITGRKAAEDTLRRSHDTFYGLIEDAPLGIYIIDADFRLVQASAGSQKVFAGVRPLLGRDFSEVLRAIWPEPFASEAIARFRHTLATGEPYHASDTTELRVDIDQVESYDWQIRRIALPDGRHGVVCYFYDMTAHRRAELAVRRSERRLAAQHALLEMIAQGAPLQDVLDELTLFVETQEQGAIGGILLTDDGVHFRPGNGPNLPDAYLAVLHEAIKTEIAAPPYFGSCAEALHRGQTVEVADVEQDTRYAPAWTAALLSSGLRAVGSTPIRGSDGRILGCFALYYREPRRPVPADPELREIATHIAAIAIEKQRDEMALRDSEQTMRAFYDNAPVFMGIVEPTDDGDVRHIYDNPLSCGFFGVPTGGTVGLRAGADMKAAPPVLAEWLRHYQEAGRTGRPVKFEHAMPGVAPETDARWISATVASIGSGPSGRPRYCYVAEDVTERKRQEQRQLLLTDELNHRVKNTLAVIQAIASQTLRHTPDPRAFRQAFSERLLALSRAHDLLTKQMWRGIPLKELVATALRAFGEDGDTGRLTWGGPAIMVPAHAAVSLSLALHELATNAAKYGALSRPGGRVDLAWTLRPDPAGGTRWIEIHWTESGGPPVAPPSKQGFGRRVVEGSVSQLGGTVDLAFPSDGARCRLALPVPA